MNFIFDVCGTGQCFQINKTNRSEATTITLILAASEEFEMKIKRYALLAQ
jgi:hypothetical protein